MSKINKIFEFLSDEQRVKKVLERLYSPDMYHEAIHIFESFADKNLIEFYELLNEEYKKKLSDLIDEELENE